MPLLHKFINAFLPDIGAPSKDIYFLNVSISSNDTNILEFYFSI